MKTEFKNGKSHSNGAPIKRQEFLKAQQRSLKRDEKLTSDEGLEALVMAGIVTKAGKLSTRYGG